MYIYIYTNNTEATENRKEENTEYKDLMASNTAAKQLLEIAKNRLNKARRAFVT